MNFFSIDSLGKNDLANNFILSQPFTEKFRSSKIADETHYWLSSQKTNDLPLWKLRITKSGFSLHSNYNSGNALPFILCFEQHENHCTFLGIMKGDEQKISLPGILHFPDHGTLRVTSKDPGIEVTCTSQRFIEHPFVKIEFPAANRPGRAVDYRFEVVNIHPHINGIENDSRYDGFRKNFISIFQLNPRLKILSNNSSSDACAFTLFKYAMVAPFVPPLAKGLTALDLIRMTLDRYLAGQKGYGQLGYDYDKTWDIPESPGHCNSLDSYPSLLISACTYAKTDKKWFRDNYKSIKQWASIMLAADSDNDGLLEFCLSGNSGSWKGDKTQRPANWWDTIGFGHKDAYSNALAYHALQLLGMATANCGMNEEAGYFTEKANQLKAIYTTTFYNSSTGVLAGWKSADGELHDYYFTFVNGVAISYGLIEDKLANQIMDALLKKMKEVGFNNFELGLPGNLIPVKLADYTDLSPGSRRRATRRQPRRFSDL